jgi:hypothetical protein
MCIPRAVPPRRGRFRHALLFLLASAAPALAAQEQVSWEVLRPASFEAQGGATLELLPDGSLLASGGGGEREAYLLRFELPRNTLHGLRLEALDDPKLPGRGPGRGAGGNFVLSELRVLDVGRAGMKALPVTIVSATADFSQQGFPVSNAIDGDEKTGWAIGPSLGRTHTALFPFEQEMNGSSGLQFTVELVFAFGQAHSIGRFRLLGTTDAAPLQWDDDAAWEGMQERIDEAIDKGVAYLISTQELDGSWSQRQAEYPNGQTALALYTLLKQHVPATHPCVRRALEYLHAENPGKTYAMGCQLLALATLGDPEVRPWMEELVSELLDWQQGGFAYPDGAVDISNSQYGALGLWAASKAGIEIPKKAWLELARHVIGFQGGSDESPYAAAGFGYQPGGHQSGSRTTAGVGILALCEKALGPQDMKGLPIARAKQKGLAWLAKNFSAKENPRCEPGDPWVYYYLYGLERVGAFTGVTHIGGTDWYREGARFIVGEQTPKGCWTEGTAEEQANTCFAILFLSRASASATGMVESRDKEVYGSDDPAREVSLRASGDTPLTAWVSSFGAELERTWAWPAERGGGLRVRAVQFLESGEDRAPAYWKGPWSWTTRTPADGWTQSTFTAGSWAQGQGAFGDPDTGGSLVRTPWREEELWLWRSFDVDPAELVEPTLCVFHADAAARAGLVASGGARVCLFDEQLEFGGRLKGVSGTSRVTNETHDVLNGALALRVTAQQRFELQIPGWGWAIRENPRASEYRWLRYAWKSVEGGGVMVQLADSGGWSGHTVRYFAGKNVAAFEPAVCVDEHLPKEWTVVTRDLWRDCGGDALLTGIALTPMDGEALFDGFWLARTRADLPDLGRPGIAETKAVEASAPRAKTSLQVWLNDRPLWSGDLRATEHEPLVLDHPLEELLHAGPNVIAVQVKSLGAGDLFDIELRDRPLLAQIAADPSRPAGEQRLASRFSFSSPGVHAIRARVALVLDGTQAGETRASDGQPDTFWVESEPLEVRVDEALDPDLLIYAGDRARNLLRDAGAHPQASTEFAGWPAVHACDGVLANSWLCAAGDPDPALSIELDRAVRADRIQLSPIRTTRIPDGQMARAGRAEIVLNKKLRHVLEIDESNWKKSVLVLEKPLSIRHLEIRLVRDPSLPKTAKDAVGLSEVELMLAGR